MFSDSLSIEPTYTFGEGDGSEVLVAFAGESVAVYIGGERVYESDDLPTSRLMRILSEKTDGNLAAFASREAVRDRRTGETLYNEELPADPNDIVFSDELEVITLQDAEDLREKLQHSRNKYVIVQIRAGIIDEEMVRDYASDEIGRKIIEIQDRA